ncbi:MAG TPA: response regulator [Candidatus Polarisedimenticolaceae bacterium]|nr:response regulator [Candidatus Polarisedimenticolaceae bacterium]
MGSELDPRILVADDNADIRRYIVRILGERYRTLAVADGEAALALARASVPDLVLSDVMMPRLDGFGLLRGLRADPRTRNVPVIMLSARAGEDSRVDGMEAGADDYLVKPFSARELHARVAAHLAIAEERRRVRETLEDSNRRMDDFMATLAHEIRNPLAPIRNGLEILRLAKDDPGAAEQAREMMERQVGHMVRLIDDLMDVSRISRGKIVLRRSRIDLAEPLGQAIEASRPAIDERGHTLTLLPADEPLPLDADVTRLSQIFSNLLNNAAKYMEPNGSIAVEVTRDEGSAVVRIRDAGVGISAAMLPKVFDMFTHADGVLERAQGGLGVGLSLVKSLVEMHGGTVEAASAGPGLGSTFTIRLPLARAAAVVAEAGAAPASVVNHRRRVLVVDDNRDAAVSLAKMLELMGNDTRTAYDGLEALVSAAAFRPDLVMLDIGMPRLNGLDTARKIRSEAWGKQVTLVALTGWGQMEDRRRTIEAGFDGHLVKPVEPEKLTEILSGLPRGNPSGVLPESPAAGAVTS